MLAMRLGITAKSELRQIAVGAMLHDLGKLGIPESILTKPGMLDDRELDLVKSHPVLGFRKLCRRSDLNYGQLMMVYQHHERMDGLGYPVGSAADEIHAWTRICSVVDVFEALTSNRPYRAHLRIDEVLGLMDLSSGTRFDRGVYECWKATIKTT
jgi:HD-GYP domain-containing protein (c-di-GMP phosphodiesterase class II)